MIRTLFVLAIGVVIGYFAGFRDAKKHGENVVSRAVARVGGSHRDNFRTDVDRAAAAAER